MKSFLKFGALSGGGWLLDCGLLLLLSQVFGIHVSVANFISSSIAALLVFSVSRLFVFEGSGTRPALKTLVYFMYTCGVIVVASFVISLVVWAIRMGAEYFLVSVSKGQAAFLAKVVVTPPQLLANFFMSRFLARAS